MEENPYIVIMAGGVGSRFWPYSRNSRPKQFIDVLGTGKSLLRMTYERFVRMTTADRILIVTNENYKGLVQEQLPELLEENILLEPYRRNTAPCVAYAAYKIREKNPKAVMVVTPADHAIFKEEQFIEVIQNACNAASDFQKLITVGIKPNRPETGYGYIQFHETENQNNVKPVKTFTEKPELELAKKFIESGDFVWNAGIFIWSVSTIISSFESSLPEMAEIFEEGKGVYYGSEEEKFINKAYSQSKNISIDYGIMEKAENVFVVFGDFDWSDLGSWNSLHEARDKDDNDNVIEANALLSECKDNYVKSETNRLVVLNGLEGYLVADFDDVLLVCKKDSESKFREFVAQVKSEKGEKYL